MKKIFWVGLILAVLVTGSFLFYLSNSGKIIIIDKCQEITKPGSYMLIKNINATISNCLTINSDNVFLNGGGYSIESNGQNNKKAIDIENVNNVVVKNFRIVNYENGIYSSEANYISIINNSFIQNLQAIYLSSSSDNEISKNYIENSQNIGLILSSSNGNTITENEIESSLNPLFIEDSSDNLIFSNIYENNLKPTLKLNRSSPIINQNEPTNFQIILGPAANCISCSYKPELTPEDSNLSYMTTEDGLIEGTFTPTKKESILYFLLLATARTIQRLPNIFIL